LASFVHLALFVLCLAVDISAKYTNGGELSGGNRRREEIFPDDAHF
jgi:hypothetical protein